MRIREVLLTAAAGLMAVTPVAASAAGAVAPSRVGVERVGAPTNSSEQIGGGSSWLLVALAAIAVGVGIYLIVDNGDDQPASP